MNSITPLAAASGLVGSNATIDALRRTGQHVVKTHTRRGIVWHYSDTLTPIPTATAERLMAKGILIARELSGQSWELAEGWR